MVRQYLPQSLLPQSAQLVLGAQQRVKCLWNTDSVPGEMM